MILTHDIIKKNKGSLEFCELDFKEKYIIYYQILLSYSKINLENDTIQENFHGNKLLQFSFSNTYNIPLSQYIKEINKNKEVKLALHDFHPTSEIKRVEQFAMCRFGGLDFQGDIKNGELQDGEYWPCPNHGKCQFEGILCKLPLVNGQRLTKQEVDLIKLSSTDKTNDVIAEDLGIPLGTFHQLKHKLYEKFFVQTKQELTKLSAFLNII